MSKPKEKQKSQKQRFIEAARKLECDESEKAFEDTFERVVPPKRGTDGAEDDSEA
ncbi:MAG: hypothetical protein DHS20C05_06210 [Hyphococcus sp.]|nr:MAG: hypothetical protein DHS20C05_06210 [Marinicaulis sp.]